MWEFIGNVANVLGIVTAIPVILAALLFIWKCFTRKKAEIKALKNYKVGSSASLSITVGKNESIGRDVARFIDSDETLNNCIGERQFEIHINEMLDEKNGIDVKNELLKALREKETLISDSGATSICLFYSGPSVLGAVIGAYFSNRYSVIMYQFNAANHKYYEVAKIVE